MSIDREEIASRLELAADKIEKHGWVQGMYFGDDGRICASTALQLACGSGRIFLNKATRPVLVGACEFALADATGHTNIELWNDRGDMTKQDVLDAFRKAAVQAREKVQP